MVKIVLSFFATKAGLYVLLGLFALGAAGAFLHGRAVSRLVADTRDQRDMEWTIDLAGARLAQAQREAEMARDIASANAALAEARLLADASEADRTRTVIKEVVRVSPSAGACVFDRVEADALNGLRLGR